MRQLKLPWNARQTLIDNLAEDQAYFAEISAAADAYDAADDAVDAATDAFEALGYEAPVAANGAVLATAESDIFTYSDPATGVLTSTITNFGAAGTDLLAIGEGFTAVNLEAGVDITTTNQGAAGALEVFIQQQGGNAVLYIEDDNFDGSLSTGVWGGNTITLVGVDASTLSLEDGIIRVNTDAAIA